MTYQWRLFLATLNPAKGSEQAGKRPVLVISRETLNQLLPVVNVALQEVGRPCRKIYEADYVQTRPDVEALHQAMGHIFQAKTKRTVQKRYDQVITLQPQFVQDNAEAVANFDLLERQASLR